MSHIAITFGVFINIVMLALHELGSLFGLSFIWVCKTYLRLLFVGYDSFYAN